MQRDAVPVVFTRRKPQGPVAEGRALGWLVRALRPAEGSHRAPERAAGFLLRARATNPAQKPVCVIP